MRKVLIISLCIILGFGIGFGIGKLNVKKPDVAVNTDENQTFYATIKSIKQYNDGSTHITVRGLDVNDINYRGNYVFKVNENINMTWRGEKINVSDLKEDNKISITFKDEEINDIDPTPLKEVTKIQLLEDEK